jgi:excinuclease UvrABC ATPase subunit
MGVKIINGHALYLLEEPSTNFHLNDIFRLLNVFQLIMNAGNIIIVGEDNLEVIITVD